MTQALNLANFANNLNTSGATSNAGLQNSSVTVTAGTGLSGGGSVALGSSVTLTNAGVTSIVAGTGISISGATGAVTVSASSSGGVTSVNGQTGAVVLTDAGSIGSIGTFGNAAQSDLAYSSTTAGSNLRYNTTNFGSGFTNNSPFAGVNQTVNSGYTGGGTALSGTWRKLSTGAVYNAGVCSCSGATFRYFYNALYIRVS